MTYLSSHWKFVPLDHLKVNFDSLFNTIQFFFLYHNCSLSEADLVSCNASCIPCLQDAQEILIVLIKRKTVIVWKLHFLYTCSTLIAGTEYEYISYVVLSK